MTRLRWHDPGTRLYEKGVDRGVFYPVVGNGVPWVGLTAVDIRPTGGEATSYYIDGRKYLVVHSPEEFEAVVRAYTYPDEFSECDGTAKVHSGLFATQQPRKPFGLSYRTLIGNEMDPNYGYKIHLVYNAWASPSPRSYNTLGESGEAVDFEWTITTLPPDTPGLKPTSHFEIDTRSSNPSAIADVEDILYGTDEAAPRLPTLSELIEVFDAYAILSVTDNGDGTFTVDGPDDAITMLDASTFQITWPSAVPLDETTWSLSSL